MSAGLTFRPLRWYDCAFVYRLASEPSARAMFLDPTPPTLLGHLRHFWRDLHEWRHREWVAVLDGRRVGHVFADLHGADVEVSVNLRPRARGKRLGSRLIAFGSERVRAGWWVPFPWGEIECQCHAIEARIKPENVASMRAFAAAGYVETARTPTLVRMEYRPNRRAA